MHSRYASSNYLPDSLLNPCQVAASNLRFGDGVTAEVGMDLKNMKARKVFMHNFDALAYMDPIFSRLEFSPIPTWLSSGL